MAQITPVMSSDSFFHDRSSAIAPAMGLASTTRSMEPAKMYPHTVLLSGWLYTTLVKNRENSTVLMSSVKDWLATSKLIQLQIWP
jgi:hypothetical protein